MAYKANQLSQVGDAARAQGEAVRIVERLRTRLRAVAASTSRASKRPRVISLEGLAPLCLGKPFGACQRSGRLLIEIDESLSQKI